MKKRILANLYRYAGVATLALAITTRVRGRNANW